MANDNPALSSAAHGGMRFADLKLHEDLHDDLHEKRRSKDVIELTTTEFALLRYLLQDSGRDVSKAQILAHVWSYDRHGDGIVESYISYLRKKLDRLDPSLIHTLRGVGYSLRVGRATVSEGMR